MTPSARQRWRIACRATLSINVVIVLAGLWCVQVGPAPGVFLGVLGLMILVAGVVTHRQISTSADADYAESSDARTTVDRIGNAAGKVGVLSLIVAFATMGAGGVPEGSAADRPVFASRPSYRLNDHGQKTEVSRLRFTVANGSFFLGWFGLLLYANGVCHRAVSRLRIDGAMQNSLREHS